jgi:hypothetical protein
MEFIIHRVNEINYLNTIPLNFGCEIDVRSDGSKLILNHDPYKGGDLLLDFLDEYKHRTLVLNIKESGIEDHVLAEVKKRKINSYFLLDVEAPYLYYTMINKEKNIAVRFSEYEPIENVEYFFQHLDWVWIDCVNENPINKSNVELLKNFKCCYVCPSRWGRPDDIFIYVNKFKKLNITPDYVMTEINQINNWQKAFDSIL